LCIKFVLVIFAYNLKPKDMTTLRNKVTENLIKKGNNPQDVNEMVNTHFDYASKNYNTVKSISECIRTIY